jgi:SulP family sulfate permease
VRPANGPGSGAVAAEGGRSDSRAGLGQDLFAGAIGGVLSVAYGLSYAALIYSGPLSPWLAFGVSASLITSAISASVIAARSSLPFTIGGPDGSTSAVIAALAAASVERLVAAHAGSDLLHPVVIVIGLATAATGIFLGALGLTRAGRAIRFVPYPVIGGFLGATGWVMMVGALRVVTGHRPDFTHLGAWLVPGTGAKLAAAGGFALVLGFGLRRLRHPLALPGLILAGLAAAHVGFWLSGMSIPAAQAAGWTFRPQAGMALATPLDAHALGVFPWSILPSLAGELVSVMFVTAICILLSTTGVEFATRREANLDRELNSFGVANILAAALGGYANCTALARTTLNYAAGARGRAGGMTVALISAAVIAIGPGFLAYMPKFLLGGILLYMGWNLIQRWLIDTLRRLPALEYVSLLAITMIIVNWGFVAGVAIGVVIGCAAFAISASRVHAIKFSFDGSEYRSSLDRDAEETAVLAEHGGEIQGVCLQSYLFFGVANRLHEHVKAILAERPHTRFLVIDFRQVIGFDSSATHSFGQIRQATQACGAELVLVQLVPGLSDAFAVTGVFGEGVVEARDLDHALEACENAVIEAHRGRAGEARTLVQWLSAALGSTEHAATLGRLCTRSEAAIGSTIAHQGDPTDCMHFILAGRVGIIVELADGRRIRVRSLGPHTMVGEMGLITGNPRSATIEAESDSVLYALAAETFDRLKAENPALCQALSGYVISVMAERLSFANRLYGVLQR